MYSKVDMNIKQNKTIPLQNANDSDRNDRINQRDSYADYLMHNFVKFLVLGNGAMKRPTAERRIRGGLMGSESTNLRLERSPSLDGNISIDEADAAPANGQNDRDQLYLSRFESMYTQALNGVSPQS